MIVVVSEQKQCDLLSFQKITPHTTSFHPSVTKVEWSLPRLARIRWQLLHQWGLFAVRNV